MTNLTDIIHPAGLVSSNDTQTQTDWETGTSTNEGLVSPAKVAAAIAALVDSPPTQSEATWEAGTSTIESLVSPAKVAAAIDALTSSHETVVATDFSGTDGYIKYSSGLILQWGYKADTGGTMTITYPLAFPNQVFSFQSQMVRNSANYQNITVNSSYATSLSGVTVYWDSAADGILWFAIGR